MAGDRVNTYVVRGLLKDEGPARVMDGSFVLMDIAAAQLAFDRLGRVDRVDVQLRTEASRRPPPPSTPRSPPSPHGCLPASPHSGRRGAASRSSRCWPHFTSTSRRCPGSRWSSGLFLVYNTVTISVIARREEIGTLRALGVTRRQVLALFLGEAAALGIAGTVLGIGVGRLLADARRRAHRATVSTLYIATAAAPPRSRRGTSRWRSPSAFRSRCSRRWLPAREASRVSPTAAMRGADRLESRVRLRPSAWSFPRWCWLEPCGWRSWGPSMAARSSAMPRRLR